MSNAPSRRGLPGALRNLRYHVLLPSIFTWIVMRSVLFMFLYAGSMALMIGVLSDAKKVGDLESGLGGLLMASFAAAVINFLGCSLLSLTFIGLGRELRDFSLFTITKLWPLAFRMLAIPTAIALVVAPSTTAWLLYQFDTPIRHGWLFGLNLALLHTMFCVGAMFVGLVPAVNRWAQWAIKSLFPFRIIGNLITVASFWILFFFAHLLRVVLENSTVEAMQMLNDLAKLVEMLMSVPGAGPLVVFWLNPYYLLMRMHTGEEFGLAAPAAFGLACAIATMCMALRLRYWMNVDLDERSIQIYDDWLEWRHTIPISESPTTEQRSALIADDLLSTDNLSPVVIEKEEEEEAKNPDEPKHTFAGDLLFLLPNAPDADVYVIEQSAPREVYPNRICIIIGLGLALSAVYFGKWMLFIAWVAWLAVTISTPWPATRASLIMPLKIMSALRWIIHRRIMPMLAIDAACAVIVCVVFQINPLGVIAFACVFFSARFLALNLQIGYALQSLRVVLFTLGCWVVYAIMGMGAILSVAEERYVIQLIAFAGVCAGSVILAWLNLLWMIWRRFGWLQHKALP